MRFLWLAAAAAAGDAQREVNASYGIVRLTRPWPVGLGRISPAAARAVRASSPNDTDVLVPMRRAEWAGLAGAAGAELVHPDAAAFYESRMLDAADPADPARRLGARSRPGPSFGQRLRTLAERRAALSDLTGSMGGYLTLSEAQNAFAQLAAKYPTWASRAATVGRTRQNRPIELYCVTLALAECALFPALPRAVTRTSAPLTRRSRALALHARALSRSRAPPPPSQVHAPLAPSDRPVHIPRPRA